jgi:hypothetical protein
MFSPTRDQVRQFFFDARAKQRRREMLTGMEDIAVGVIVLHPEYHALLDEPERVRDKEYAPEAGESNPFLHMSMHLAIEEQLSIDQPPGIRAEFERIARKLGDRHAATHEVLECLGETVWRAQREGAQPDTSAYLECVRKRGA